MYTNKENKTSCRPGVNLLGAIKLNQSRRRGISIGPIGQISGRRRSDEANSYLQWTEDPDDQLVCSGVFEDYTQQLPYSIYWGSFL